MSRSFSAPLRSNPSMMIDISHITKPLSYRKNNSYGSSQSGGSCSSIVTSGTEFSTSPTPSLPPSKADRTPTALPKNVRSIRQPCSMPPQLDCNIIKTSWFRKSYESTSPLPLPENLSYKLASSRSLSASEERYVPTAELKSYGQIPLRHPMATVSNVSTTSNSSYISNLSSFSKLSSRLGRFISPSPSPVSKHSQKDIVPYLRPMKTQLNYISHNQTRVMESMQTMQMVLVFMVGCLCLLIYADAMGTSIFHWNEKNVIRKVLHWVLNRMKRYSPFIIFFMFLLFRFSVACYFSCVVGLLILLFTYPEPVLFFFALWMVHNYWNWTKLFKYRFQRTERQCYTNGPRPMVSGVAGHADLAERTKPPRSRTRTYRRGRKDHHRTNKRFLHDMDHIHIPLWSYLWLCVFVMPNAAALMFFGNLYWRFRQIFVDRKLITPLKCDQAEVLANLTLHTSQVRNFKQIVEKDGRKIAIFRLQNFDMLNGDNECERVEYVEWHIDLEDKVVVYNRFKLKKSEERELQIGDLLCLLYYQNISSNHVQGHTFANWGTDNESQDPFIRRMSNITVIYNYFGRTVFVGLTHFLHFIGLTRFGHRDFGDTVQSGLDQPIVNHSNIRELAKYSDWVHFVTQLRGSFLEEFEIACARGDFGMVDGEALFVGTVIHSLDHLMLEKCVDETTWFTSNTKEFEPMQWCCRIVRAGFVDDIPAISFDFSFKDAPEGFYSKVYRTARNINRFYADNIYCCIIK